MARKDYFEREDGKLRLQLENYKTTIATEGATVGLAPAEITAAQADATAIIESIDAIEPAKGAYDAAIASKRDTKKAGLGRLRATNRRIKTAPGYTQTIGEILGIIGEESEEDIASAKPRLSVVADGGSAVLDFDKGFSDGVRIYSRRGAETAAAFLVHDTHAPYIDNRPNLPTTSGAEEREYYAFYVDADGNQYGLQSDTVTVKI